jgi:hypothetical protein
MSGTVMMPANNSKRCFGLSLVFCINSQKALGVCLSSLLGPFIRIRLHTESTFKAGEGKALIKSMAIATLAEPTATLPPGSVALSSAIVLDKVRTLIF